MSRRVEIFNSKKHKQQLGGGETESYRRVPDPHYSDKEAHKSRSEYHKKNDKIMAQLYLAWIDFIASLPKNKTFLEEMEKKQEKKHPPFP